MLDVFVLEDLRHRHGQCKRRQCQVMAAKPQRRQSKQKTESETGETGNWKSRPVRPAQVLHQDRGDIGGHWRPMRVMFVNWYEAEAWCRWAKRRLPTEAEWEAAALGEAAANGSCLADSKRRWPWGEQHRAANTPISDLAFDGPLDVAACLRATAPSDAVR